MFPLYDRRSLALVTLVVLTLVVSLIHVSPAAAAIDSSAESQFACRVNKERKSSGRSSLRVASDLREIARRHSVRMADQNLLHHNPKLGTEVKGWSVVAENVGRGASVDSLHKAFMGSTGHRANILDNRVTEIGVGVERRGSTVWVTKVFRRPSGAATGSIPSCSTPIPATVPAGAISVAGDWTGNGRSTPGAFLNGRWYLSNGLTGKVDTVIDYGRRGDVPVVGDWNGNGKDTIGIIRDGTWHLRNSLSGGTGQIRFTYGQISRGDVPIVGDWNGNRKDTIGIVRDGQWHLRNSLSGGSGQVVFTYGRVLDGDRPVIGDWNRNGRAGVGIVRSAQWHLRNSLSGGGAQLTFKF